MGLSKKEKIAVFRLIAGVFCLCAFVIHMAFFTVPFDLEFLIHRCALSTTFLLCFFMGLSVWLYTSFNAAERFDVRVLFLFVMWILCVTLVSSTVFLYLKWFSIEFVESIKTDDILGFDEKMELIVILVMSSVGAFMLLLGEIFNSYVMILRSRHKK